MNFGETALIFEILRFCFRDSISTTTKIKDLSLAAHNYRGKDLFFTIESIKFDFNKGNVLDFGFCKGPCVNLHTPYPPPPSSASILVKSIKSQV